MASISDMFVRDRPSCRRSRSISESCIFYEEPDRGSMRYLSYEKLGSANIIPTWSSWNVPDTETRFKSPRLESCRNLLRRMSTAWNNLNYSKEKTKGKKDQEGEGSFKPARKRRSWLVDPERRWPVQGW
ncbi:hypothetical protein O6H91_17G036700 [Diphasiastrum complanatum]|uniref:Uncharacterized protein n=1 Tax=Diphasiastrum complanatum TaxID=34168 RepID=A0ACC2B5S2_DIPCM|nr:hypothetical protein O6H91_17G036700 [Diphasiastrum complanatum]